MFGRPFNVGFICLAIYLLLVGLMGLAAVAIPAVIPAIFALIAGIFLLIGR